MNVQLATLEQHLSLGRTKEVSLAANIEEWSGNTNKPVQKFFSQIEQHAKISQ
jgi:hypothetical protein